MAAALALVAAEPAAAYDRDVVGEDRLGGLSGAIDQVVAVSTDELDEPALRAELAALETATRRLSARSSRAVAALTARQVARAQQARPDDPRAGRRAARQVRDQMQDQLGWSPSRAKDAQELGGQIDQHPALAEALDSGEVTSKNATRLQHTLRRLFIAGIDKAERDRLEARLLQAARVEDPVAFAKTCRALLAEADHAGEAKAEERRHARRHGSITKTTDGMTSVYAEWATVDGAIFKSAAQAFRRPDRPDEHRTPEQATADALVAMAQAALGGTGAPTEHGQRPHVVITVPIQTLLDHAGPVDIDGTTVPLDAIRHQLDDAGYSFILTNQRHLPTAVTTESRSVPVGLWRALMLRDGGCIHHTCDLPARWTDVMHLDVPYDQRGRLSLSNGALGCRTHHRAYDNGRLQLHITHDGRPILRPRNQHATNTSTRTHDGSQARDGPAP